RIRRSHRAPRGTPAARQRSAGDPAGVRARGRRAAAHRRHALARSRCADAVARRRHHRAARRAGVPVSASEGASMTESALLQARGLAVTIAGRSICRGLDLSIRRGECWAMLGRNGAGKTTLLHTLAGLRVPAEGSVDFAGRPLGEWSGRELARMRAVLPQDDYDAFPATV